jgi:hypothetical protein
MSRTTLRCDVSPEPCASGGVTVADGCACVGSAVGRAALCVTVGAESLADSDVIATVLDGVVVAVAVGARAAAACSVGAGVGTLACPTDASRVGQATTPDRSAWTIASTMRQP